MPPILVNEVDRSPTRPWCGEGRLPRDLKARGYEVIGIDASPTLIEHARQADPGGDYQVADAAALPVADGSVNLVTAFMSLHDVDDLDAAVREIARVMRPDATLAVAVVHPINSAGAVESSHHDAGFRIGTYETYFATLGAVAWSWTAWWRFPIVPSRPVAGGGACHSSSISARAELRTR